MTIWLKHSSTLQHCQWLLVLVLYISANQLQCSIYPWASCW